MDYTLSAYKQFIDAFINSKYNFIPLQCYNSSDKTDKIIILRHDVDRLPLNSLRISEYENNNGIKGTYYFRIKPISYNERVIKEIADLGHEIGYHYEEIDLVYRQLKKENVHLNLRGEELVDEAYKLFCKNLEIMRKIYPIKTICAHGSPLSPYDNKIIWDKYDYRKLGITSEPSLDIDWNKFAYFTDTGRRWNGNHVSVRDKVNSKFNYNYKSTNDIINNIKNLPSHLMINIHPQRWNDNVLMWSKELVTQSGKNFIKKYFYVEK